MSVRRSRHQRPSKLFIMNAHRFVDACRNGFRTLRNAGFACAGLVVLLLSGNSHGAEVIPYCEAKSYKSCPSFHASVTIGHRVEIIDNALAGFTRSDGSWTIEMRYQPAESCAIVKILLDTGPIDFPRPYERTFTGGGGQVSDNGSFMHRTDDPDGSLKILSSSCFMPADVSVPEDDQASYSGGEGEPTELDDLLERLALEEQGGASQLDEQLERLASEEQRFQKAARQRARQAALQAEQQKGARERALERRPHQKTEMETALDDLMMAYRAALERRARKEREQREQAATDTLMTGLTLGLIGGVLGALAGEGGGSFDPGALAMLSGSRGSGCDMIGQRLARELETVNRLHANSTCGMGRGTAQTLTRARNNLAARNCASGQELAQMDRSIREARATARASCGGN